jgi:hypothetical protein
MYDAMSGGTARPGSLVTCKSPLYPSSCTVRFGFSKREARVTTKRGFGGLYSNRSGQ